MAIRTQRTGRRTDALSKERIVEAAIEILDTEGENALTLRALTARLATGSGAIYWHVASMNDLLAAATGDVIALVMTETAAGTEPREAIRAIAMGVFDAIDNTPGRAPSSPVSRGSPRCCRSSKASASSSRRSASPGQRDLTARPRS